MTVTWKYAHIKRAQLGTSFPPQFTWITSAFNTLRPRQNGRHFPDDFFKRIFLNENVWISLKISLKFVPRGLINNIPALLQIMAWRRPGDKPLSEAMLVSLLTHKCVTRPQWVKACVDTYTCTSIKWNIITFPCDLCKPPKLEKG